MLDIEVGIIQVQTLTLFLRCVYVHVDPGWQLMTDDGIDHNYNKFFVYYLK